MRRHLIIGRLGRGDRVDIPTSSGEGATELQLVLSRQRLEYGIGRALEDLARLNVFPSEIGVDLLILAAHVHAADTRISRTTESQDSWTREIRLVVPVSDVARWNQTIPILQRMLNFLTGDRWAVGFRDRPRGFEQTVPIKRVRVPAPVFNSLALFSGGLDSLIGAINTLEGGGVPLLISHAGEGATSDAQKRLFNSLKQRYEQPFNRLRIWMNFPNGLVENVGSENTTRARSFLFFAAGVFAGTGLQNLFTLKVPENGLIALNVPLDPLRLGALSTRTTHPFYMARWNDLLRDLGISGRVENPYWNRTKGEMAAECVNRTLLADLAARSLSCASPTKGRWAGRGMEHCGYCLPCLIRRAALHERLGAADKTSYTIDLTGGTLDTNQAEGQQVRSFQYAIERVRQRPEIAELLIHKPGPLSDESPARRSELAEVYRRGLEEVAAVVGGVHAEPNFS
jgi:hypothetical protein